MTTRWNVESARKRSRSLDRCIRALNRTLEEGDSTLARDTLLKGTLVLAAAALVARFLGVVQRVPLEYVIGKEGNALFGAANNLYLMLLTVATAGVPSAISRLVAEETALGRLSEAERVYRAAMQFAVFAGAATAVFLFAAAPWIAAASRLPDSAPAYRAIAPTLLVFPAVAMMRGYMQGLGRMTPGGISQIWEQIVRVGSSLALAGAFVALGASIPAAAAGASFGSVLGGAAALAVMVYYVRRARWSDGDRVAAGAFFRRLRSGFQRPDAALYRKIFRISLPVTLFSLAVPAMYTADTLLWNPLLIPRMGEREALEWLGILTARAQSVAGLPIILAVALSQSVLPIIAAAHARGDRNEVARQTSVCLRLALLSGIPAVVALAAAARPIVGFLFTDAEGAGLVALLTAGAVFQILMMSAGSILMGLGLTVRPVVSVAAGVSVKIALTAVLAPVAGPYGFALATGAGFALAAGLQLYMLRREVPFAVFGRKWIGVGAAAAATAAVGVAAERLAEVVLPFSGKFAFYGAAAVLSVGAMAVVYPFLLLAFRGVGPEELAALPAPVARRVGRFLPAGVENSSQR